MNTRKTRVKNQWLYARYRCNTHIFTILCGYDLNTETLELDEDASAAAANFQALFHSLARATLEVTYQNK